MTLKEGQQEETEKGHPSPRKFAVRVINGSGVTPREVTPLTSTSRQDQPAVYRKSLVSWTLTEPTAHSRERELPRLFSSSLLLGIVSGHLVPSGFHFHFSRAKLVKF